MVLLNANAIPDEMLMWARIAEIIVINDINAFNCPLIRPFDAIAFRQTIHFARSVFTLNFLARSRAHALYCSVAQFLDNNQLLELLCEMLY